MFQEELHSLMEKMIECLHTVVLLHLCRREMVQAHLSHRWVVLQFLQGVLLGLLCTVIKDQNLLDPHSHHRQMKLVHLINITQKIV